MKLHMPQYSVLSVRFLSLNFVRFPPSPCSQTLAATLLPQERENDSKCFTASIRNRHLQSDTYLLPIIPYLYLHFIVNLHLLSRITYFNFSLNLYPSRRAHTTHHTTPQDSNHIWVPSWLLDLHLPICEGCRGQLICDGTSAETRFRLSAKRTSPFKSARRQFSLLLTAEVCALAVVMLDTPCSDVV